jgi:hypothetical protein
MVYKVYDMNKESRYRAVLTIFKTASVTLGSLCITYLGLDEKTKLHIYSIWILYSLFIVAMIFVPSTQIPDGAPRVYYIVLVGIQILLLVYHPFPYRLIECTPALLYLGFFIFISAVLYHQKVGELRRLLCSTAFVILAALYVDGIVHSLTLVLLPLYILNLHYAFVLSSYVEIKDQRRMAVALLVAQTIFNVTYPLSYAWFAWLCPIFMYVYILL